MEIITSTKNQYIKEAKALAEKKFRDISGLFLVEGVNIFKDMPKNIVVKTVFCTLERAKEIAKIVACSNAEVYYVSDDVMRYLSDTVSPYGIVGVLQKFENCFKLPSGNALLLDGVSDPGNLGTIVRSAVAADFLEIYLCETTDIYSPKVVRSTLGGLFKVKFYNISEQQAIQLLENTQSAVLDMDGVSITDSKIKSPVLFVAGNEAHGVRECFKRSAKRVFSLPMKNNIESLNVAIATAVAMYQTI